MYLSFLWSSFLVCVCVCMRWHAFVLLCTFILSYTYSIHTQLLVRTDSQAVGILVAAVDALVTLFLILTVIFFAVTASIYLAVQVRKHWWSVGEVVIVK